MWLWQWPINQYNSKRHVKLHWMQSHHKSGPINATTKRNRPQHLKWLSNWFFYQWSNGPLFIPVAYEALTYSAALYIGCRLSPVTSHNLISDLRQTANLIGRQLTYEYVFAMFEYLCFFWGKHHKNGEHANECRTQVLHGNRHDHLLYQWHQTDLSQPKQQDYSGYPWLLLQF